MARPGLVTGPTRGRAGRNRRHIIRRTSKFAHVCHHPGGTMIRRLARPMPAPVLAVGGVETRPTPQARVETAARRLDKAPPLVEKGEQAVNGRLSTSVPPVTKDTETLVKV